MPYFLFHTKEAPLILNVYSTIQCIVHCWSHSPSTECSRNVPKPEGLGSLLHTLSFWINCEMCVCSQTPDDVTKMGVAAYNAECRKIVMRYSREWEVSVVYTVSVGHVV